MNWRPQACPGDTKSKTLPLRFTIGHITPYGHNYYCGGVSHTHTYYIHNYVCTYNYASSAVDLGGGDVNLFPKSNNNNELLS
jgi:hypothetical protein